MMSPKALFFIVLAVSVPVVFATPPACLLDAVNTQPNPADLHAICGQLSSSVKEQITKACGGDTEAAMQAFSMVCSSGSNPNALITSASQNTSSSTTTSDMTPTPEATTAEGRTDSTITWTSTYYDDDCTCTKTKEHTETSHAGPNSVATTSSSPQQSPELGPNANRNGSAPYPTSASEERSGPSTTNPQAGSAPSGTNGGTAVPGGSAPGGFGSPGASGTAPTAPSRPVYRTSSQQPNSPANTGVSNIGKYTGAAAGRTFTKSFAAAAIAIAVFALIM